jgi:hypothetical protein
MLLHSRCILLSLLLGFFAMLASAMPADEPGPSSLLRASRTNVVPLVWTGPIIEGGPEYELNGTAEEILSQIITINPDYTPIPYRPKAAVPVPVKRDPAAIDCNPSENWFYAAVSQLTREARYLKSLGDATCSAEAGKCARVSCSYNTAVYFCNLRKERWGIRCSSLGQQVEDIAKKCETYSPDNRSNVAKGMLRVPGDYELWAGEANPDC